MPKIKLCNVNEVQEGQVISKITPYGPIGITKIHDRVLAFQDECTHDGAPFDQASIELSTKEIICPRHGGRFNLETGRATKLPATEALEVYEVEIQGNDVYINID